MKMKTTYLITLLLFFSCYLFSQTNVPAGNVSGTWTLSGSPYKIMGHILVPDNQTLTIEPGVVVEFMGKYKLFCNGQIVAIGTASQTIKFTVPPANIATGWLGIRYENTPITNGISSFKYCQIERVKADVLGNDAGGAFNFLNFSKCNLENCEINNNYATNGGPAIKAVSSSPTIKNCYFHNNQNYQGGDCVELENSTSLIDGNTFNEGGLTIYSSNNLTISNNHISNSNEGALIAFDSSNININSNIFENNNNRNGAGGGAILLYNSSAVIEKNILRNNSTEYPGGAITCYSNSQITSTIISHNLIYGNHSGSSAGGAGTGGGAIACFRNSPKIINNTICNNNSPNVGGALYCDFGSNPLLYNNIIYNNLAANAIQNIYLNDNLSDPSFYNNNLQGGLNGIDTNGNPLSGSYTANIDLVPLFVDEANQNYQLFITSPCINSGINTINGIMMPQNDLVGNSRIAESIIDLGALEYQGNLNNKSFNKTSGITFHPNPSTDTITFTSDIENVSIYDLSGRLIQKNNIIDRKSDISTLPSGNYILKVSSMGIENNFRLIKQ